MVNEISKESVFNEAALKMRRIDKSWDYVNMLRTHLLSWNSEFGEWNYQVVISQLFSLCLEVRGKMTDPEKESFNNLRKEIIDLIEEKPIYSQRKENSLGDNKSFIIFNKDNWKRLREKIFELEDFCRDQQEAHGVSGSSKKDVSKSIVDM